jgi:cell division protein FtsQ
MIADYRHRSQPPKPKRNRSAAGRLFRLILIFALLAGLAYGGRIVGGWLSGTNLFRMDKIAVRGLMALPPESISAAAAVEPGANLFRIDIEAVEARLAVLDRIETVRVKRALPRTLSVVVVERSPLALAVLDRIYEVDARGRLMETIESATLPDLPLLTGLNRADFELGSEKIELLKPFLADLERLQREQPWLVDLLSDIEVGSDGELTAHAHQGGVRVLLGKRLEPVQLGILHTMLRDLDRTGRRAVSIDLRYRKQGILRGL